MSKAVLLSIQPKWCELIVSGQKTVEVRKTKPKLPTPFKCYIYQTKRSWVYNIYTAIADWQRKVIGEFVCDEVFPMSITYSDPNSRIALKEFPYTCLTDKQIMDYLGNGNTGFGWHISNLVIYDVPKELEEFKCADHVAIKKCGARERMYNNPDFAYGIYLPGEYYCNKDSDFCSNCKTKNLTHAPQSWCYVEYLEDEQ